MKRKVITLEIETDATNRELKLQYAKGDTVLILCGKKDKSYTILQVQVNNIDTKKK